jgi:hypothetical protein
MSTAQTATAGLTAETIESVIGALPVQGRVMLRLLLLQYLDVTPEDIEYMAADRPDPRLVSGSKPLVQVVARETIQGLINRVAQYRAQTRRKREQIWLQIDCLRKQIAYGEALCAQAERLLRERFGLEADAVGRLHEQARAAISKPAIRELDRQWEKNEIAEDEYLRKRLGIEYQTEVRKLGRERKRLESALRDYTIASHTPLQDHEIGHIWGIPASTLAARKAKFLHQYLQGLQAALQQAGHPVCGDLWKETFNVLAGRPVERSMAAYDGMDKTEAALMANLTSFAMRTIPEELESRAWLAISLSLFALQRLSSIQAERDMNRDALERVLLQRASPALKEQDASSTVAESAQPAQTSDWQEHILRSMRGEDRR